MRIDGIAALYQLKWIKFLKSAIRKLQSAIKMDRSTQKLTTGRIP
ncbi:hypothetical protein D1AOALGA4SA_4929 [Olavius algarvensis Delta 1 endosymbiont]|nr:hypothetical protein D1AOALGA4SA_4929 [Olavius algarvensis Delta 1 endosymbiont]